MGKRGILQRKDECIEKKRVLSLPGRRKGVNPPFMQKSYQCKIEKRIKIIPILWETERVAGARGGSSKKTFFTQEGTKGRFSDISKQEDATTFREGGRAPLDGVFSPKKQEIGSTKMGGGRAKRVQTRGRIDYEPRLSRKRGIMKKVPRHSERRGFDQSRGALTNLSIRVSRGGEGAVSSP